VRRARPLLFAYFSRASASEPGEPGERGQDGVERATRAGRLLREREQATVLSVGVLDVRESRNEESEVHGVTFQLKRRIKECPVTGASSFQRTLAE
jgi:hypothetical protein